MADTPELDRTDEVTQAADVVTEDVVTEDVLVEEVSIDGMCGVY
jgi:mycofactocin precursor